MLFPELLIES